MGYGIIKNLGTTLVPSDYIILEYNNSAEFLNGIGAYEEISAQSLDSDVWNSILHFGFFYATLAGAKGENGTKNKRTKYGGIGSPGEITQKTEIEVLPGDVFYVGVASRARTHTNYICSLGRGGTYGEPTYSYAIIPAFPGKQPCGGGGGSAGTGTYTTDTYGKILSSYYGARGGVGGFGSFIMRIRDGVTSYVLVGNGGGGGGGGGVDGIDAYDAGGYAGMCGYNGAGAGGLGKTAYQKGIGGRDGQSASNPYGYTNMSVTNNYAILELPVY